MSNRSVSVCVCVWYDITRDDNITEDNIPEETRTHSIVREQIL